MLCICSYAFASVVVFIGGWLLLNVWSVFSIWLIGVLVIASKWVCSIVIDLLLFEAKARHRNSIQHCVNIVSVIASISILSVFDKIYLFGVSIKFSKPESYNQILSWADVQFSLVAKSGKFEQMIWVANSELPDAVRNSIGGGRVYCVIYSSEAGRAEYLRVYKDIGFGCIGFAVSPRSESAMSDNSAVGDEGVLSGSNRVSIGMFRR